MNIGSNFGAVGGGKFNPQEMRANFGKMKEAMRAQNPEMAKKMDQFESQLDALKEKGSFSLSDIKNAAKQAGLPEPGGEGFPAFGEGMPDLGAMGGAQPNFMSLLKGLEEDSEGATQTDYRSRALSAYGANAQGGGQLSLAQSLIDMMS